MARHPLSNYARHTLEDAEEILALLDHCDQILRARTWLSIRGMGRVDMIGRDRAEEVRKFIEQVPSVREKKAIAAFKRGDQKDQAMFELLLASRYQLLHAYNMIEMAEDMASFIPGRSYRKGAATAVDLMQRVKPPTAADMLRPRFIVLDRRSADAWRELDERQRPQEDIYRPIAPPAVIKELR